MEKFYLSYLFAILFASVCGACSDENKVIMQQIEMPEGMELSIQDETVVIVNSASECKTLFGESYESLKSVDFETYDLVYLQGGSAHGIKDIQTLWNLNTDPYQLSIVIVQDYTTEYARWAAGFLMLKEQAKEVVVSVNYR